MPNDGAKFIELIDGARLAGGAGGVGVVGVVGVFEDEGPLEPQAVTTRVAKTTRMMCFFMSPSCRVPWTRVVTENTGSR